MLCLHEATQQCPECLVLAGSLCQQLNLVTRSHVLDMSSVALPVSLICEQKLKTGRNTTLVIHNIIMRHLSVTSVSSISICVSMHGGDSELVLHTFKV